MKITGKVQIQILHGNHLCITAARCASLDAKAWTQRRLTKSNHRLLLQLAERFPQPYAGGRLSLSGRRRIDCCHQNQLAVRSVLNPL